MHPSCISETKPQRLVFLLIIIPSTHHTQRPAGHAAPAVPSLFSPRSKIRWEPFGSRARTATGCARRVCWVAYVDGTMEAPRTVEDVFDNFSARRSGLITALTTGTPPALKTTTPSFVFLCTPQRPSADAPNFTFPANDWKSLHHLHPSPASTSSRGRLLRAVRSGQGEPVSIRQSRRDVGGAVARGGGASGAPGAGAWHKFRA